MEEFSLYQWLVLGLLGALVVTQAILIVMAAGRRAMLVEVVGAILSRSGHMMTELREIRDSLQDTKKPALLRAIRSAKGKSTSETRDVS
jgi:hypothetical protein